jgi:lysophospholipase L1-like esterase
MNHRVALRTKTVFSALLVVLCSVLGTKNVPAAGHVSQWEPDIRAFQNRDRTNPPPQQAVLFIGSSSIRKWHTLAKDFPGVRVINRGFGGSEIHDSTKFASRIIFPYQPRVIVFYAGDNDLAAGMPPGQVVAEYRNFVATVHAKLPATRIVFLSIKPSPIRWNLKDKMVETNRRIEAISKTRSYLAFVDVYTPMLDAGGNPRKDLFLSDGLHPDEKAYHIWAAKIKPYLNWNKN